MEEAGVEYIEGCCFVEFVVVEFLDELPFESQVVGDNRDARKVLFVTGWSKEREVDGERL